MFPNPVWPTLHRDEEFDRGLTALEAGTRGLLLVGESGTGKTVLAERIARSYAEKTGTAELPIVGAASDAGMPWGTMARHVGELEFDDDQIALERVVRPSGPAEFLLLRIDDAHLLDDMSSRYVSWLVRSGHAAFIATTRTFRFLPETLQLLVKDCASEEITVGPFDRQQTGELVSHVLNGPVRDVFTHRLWRHTGGNALFLREMIRDGMQTGALVQDPEGWDWDGDFRPTRQLRDLLKFELDSLPDAVRTVIEIAALGEPMPRTSLLDLVDEYDYGLAVESGLVRQETVQPAGVVAVRPSHPLIGEVVRDIVPTGRRRDLYQRANLHRARAGMSETPTARLRSAMWALECGVDPGFDALVAAAVAATRLHDFDRTVTLAGEALSRSDLDDAARVHALAVRAFALSYVGDQELCRADLAQAWRLLQTGDTVAGLRTHRWQDSAADIVTMRAGLAQYLDDDPHRAQEIAADGAWAMRLRSESAAEMLPLELHGWAGNWEVFMPAAERILHNGGSELGGEEFRLAPAYAYGLAVHGHIGAALDLCRWAVETAHSNSEAEPWMVGQMRKARHHAALWSGDVELARRSTAADADEDLPFVRFEWDLASAALAEVLMAEGRWSDALAKLKHVAARIEDNDQGGITAYVWILRAHVEAVTGQRSARDSLARARREKRRSARVLNAEMDVFLLKAAAVLGEDVAGQADELIARASARGLKPAELDALHVRYLLLGSRGNAAPRADLAARIGDVANQIDVPRARLIGEHVAALEAGDDARARQVATSLAEHGVSVDARTPRPGLTAREREIAAWAASGLTSRAIAEKLHLSVRTVDSHLSRIFAKLHVSSRTELSIYI